MLVLAGMVLVVALGGVFALVLVSAGHVLVLAVLAVVVLAVVVLVPLVPMELVFAGV